MCTSRGGAHQFQTLEIKRHAFANTTGSTPRNVHTVRHTFVSATSWEKKQLENCRWNVGGSRNPYGIGVDVSWEAIGCYLHTSTRLFPYGKPTHRLGITAKWMYTVQTPVALCTRSRILLLETSLPKNASILLRFWFDTVDPFCVDGGDRRT